MIRAAGAVALAVFLLFAARVRAEAHGSLVRSDPAAGATLAASPANLRLVFSEPLEPSLAQLSLVDARGHTLQLDVTGDPHDVAALVAPVDALAPGAYRVVWRIVSADGHPVGGSYVFRVGPAAATLEPPPEPHDAEASASWGPSVAGAPLVAAALRGLAVGSLTALAGLLMFMLWSSASPPGRAGTAAMWLAAAAPALLALHLLAWLVSATPDHLLGTALASGMLGEGALGTALGRVEIARLSLALLALWALGLARRPRLALVFAAAAVLLSGATGHANAIHPAWAIPVKAAHLLAAAAWLGGLVWLVWLVWLVTGDPADHATFRREAARVSSAALLAFLVVATSGVVATLLFLSSPADVLRSAYGAVVLAKVVGLGALALFGAYHRLRILPALPVDDRAEPRASAGANSGARLARSTQRELGVMGAVILLGGLLAYVPTPAPPVEPDPHAAHVHAPHTTPS